MFLDSTSGTTVKKISAIILIISLSSCTPLDAAKLLLPSASDGISVDAQIGDRENAIESNDTTIRAEDSTVSVDNRESSFQGKADNVKVDNADHIGLIIGFVMGALFGIAVGLLLPQYKLFLKRK